MYSYQDYRIFQDLCVLLDHGDRLVLRAFHLSPLQYHLLLLLDREEGWRLIDLSERLLCERSTVTRLVDALEREGLVCRVANQEDRRSQRVTLTEEGLRRRDLARAALEKTIQQRLDAFSPAEQRQLIEMHRRLRAVLLAEIERSQE
ncbi:MarR family transcriptional regulator [Thermosporothrix hazakensis]|jgi:DNA-binding MarR family transcriptional regulator|uniref:MarR family transcriptional regulator n=2 Tax=Thermosporothrix TaxID=768650 RepID=A0A326UAC0_THEHA|nr:MarR family transcriptional regulator [Thermosporothrix hazakensis]PZW32752.1 MarR family transcriptional regulator [Thermosporothrix hazakensis]BBH87668.1 MarR family transcriptional regulator [Thermosporothrix sp. COM3]GCE50110.1 MarR family transcriptional regulator [Thermosporothrix hazakensis]